MLLSPASSLSPQGLLKLAKSGAASGDDVGDRTVGNDVSARSAKNLADIFSVVKKLLSYTIASRYA